MFPSGFLSLISTRTRLSCSEDLLVFWLCYLNPDLQMDIYDIAVASWQLTTTCGVGLYPCIFRDLQHKDQETSADVI